MLTPLHNKYILIEKETTSKNSVGTPQEVYTTYKNTWSGVQYQGGRLTPDQYGETALSDAIFTVRYDPLINYKCRIFYGNQYYKITHIEIIGKNEGLRLRTITWTEE
jgi:head-tail adaptor